MAFYSQLFNETLVNSNPADPTFWTAVSGLDNIQIAGGFLAATTDNTLGNAATFGYFPATTDGYLDVTVHSLTNGGLLQIVVRSDATEQNCYVLSLEDNGDGTADSYIASYTAGVELVLDDIGNVPFTPGDVFRIAAFGNTLTAFQNGIQIGTATDASFPKGLFGLFFTVITGGQLTDVQVSAFKGGAITALDPAAFTFVPGVAADLTGPDANPLNPAQWSVPGAFEAFQLVSNKIEATDSGAQFSGSGFFTAFTSPPNNQYIDVTMSAFSDGSITGLLRATSDFNNGYLISALAGVGLLGVVREVSGVQDNFQGLNPAVNGQPGDVFRFAIFGSTLYVYQNGTFVGGYADPTFASGGVGLGFDPNSDQTTITASAFVAGQVTAAPTAYSVPDSRNFATFPNTSRDVQGTLIYDVQTSSNSTVPGVDSRTAGAPVDSRVSAPQNSRTPGLYGPGEN